MHIVSSICNPETGEMIEYTTRDYKHTKVLYKNAYDVTQMTCKKDVETYFSDEMGNSTIKVRWTNWAIEELLKHGFHTANLFTELSKMIISRNIVFEKSSTLCDQLCVHKKDIGKIIKKMTQAGLIRENKNHGGKLGWRYLELNPTLVFKTYEQKSSDESYGSSTRFNNLHEFYVEKWMMDHVNSYT